MALFKYMSADVAKLFAPSLKMRFTQPSDLTDPFELRPLIDFKATADELRGAVDEKLNEAFGTIDGLLSTVQKFMATDPHYPQMVTLITMFRTVAANNPAVEQQLMAEMRKHKSDLLDSLMTGTMWETAWEKFQQTIGQSVGILSLTEDPANSLMWDHYAAGHRGIVVEFDEKHPWFSEKKSPVDELRHLVQVAYVSNPHPRTMKQLTGLDILYTKNAVYGPEREWRIVKPLSDGIEVRHGVFCFDVPPDAVRAITFGCRTSPTVKEEIRRIVTTNPRLSHVRFKQAKLVGGGKIEIVNDIP